MKELKQYYNQIQKKLPCTHSYRKRFVQDLQASVDSYLNENPNADFAAIEEHFGSPEQITSAYAMEMDTSEVVKKYKLRKWIISVVAGAAALVVLMWLGAVMRASVEFSQNHGGGYVETSPIIVEEEEVYE